MKLIKCHIENFGKISDFDYDFKDGLNELCHENGWGKSTFAAFIKVMFYGFDSEGKRDELENERKRYRPWQGGVYGGSIAFAKDGKNYLAERTFGVKASEDTFVLRSLDTNMESDDYSSNLGEDIFNIDSKSFLRTIFISQNDCESVVTDSIHAKMGNLVDDTDDINNYDTVISGFQKTLNEMSPSRKTGSLYRLKDEIAERSNRLRGRQNLEESAEKTEALKKDAKNEYDELSCKLKLIAAKQQKLSGYKDSAAKKEEYERLKAEHDKRYEEFLRESEFFANGVPDEHELDKCMEKTHTLAAAVTSGENHALSEEETALYVEYEKNFADGVPDNAQIEDVVNHIHKLRETEELQRNISPGSDEKEAYARGCDEFKNGVPSEEKISGLISEWDVYQEKKSGINTKKSNLDLLRKMEEGTQENIRKKNRTAFKVSALIFIICCAAAIVLGVLSVKTVISPFVPTAAGIVCVAVFFVFCSKKKAFKNSTNDIGTPSHLPLQDEIDDDLMTMQEIKENVEEFFKEYYIPYNEYKVAENLYDIKNRSINFTRLRAKIEDFERLDKSGDIDENKKYIDEFLNRFGCECLNEKDSFEERMHRLENNVNEYLRLKKKKDSFEEALACATELEGDICGYLSEYGFDVIFENEEENPSNRITHINDAITEIKKHLENYVHSRIEYGRIGLEKDAFERNNDISALARLEKPQDGETLEGLNTKSTEIQTRMEQLHKDITDYDRRIEEYSEKLIEMDELAGELQADRERLESGKKEYELITKTKELMEKAKISFTAKYVAPMKTGFDKYLSMMGGENADRYHIDAESNVTVYEAGMQRDNRLFSRGVKDLAGVCMRMALIEAMYKDELPFVIFDDPFVNLDRERTDGAMKLLKNIGKDYQVIYFTCHPDRIVE